VRLRLRLGVEVEVAGNAPFPSPSNLSYPSIPTCRPPTPRPHQVTFVEAMPNIMPGFDKEIARLAERVLIKPRAIDYVTGVIATKVTPGVPGVWGRLLVGAGWCLCVGWGGACVCLRVAGWVGGWVGWGLVALVVL